MKVVLITGGTKGLGMSIVKELLKNSYFVIATGRSLSAGLDAVLQQTKNAAFEALDLKNDNVHEFIKLITKKYGRLYGLINNAAIGKDGVLATMHDFEIDEVMYVNTTASLKLTKYAVRSMLLNKKGRIINISSIIANTGFNGLSVYAASKAGLLGFTKSFAREVGKSNITVNAILPGYMKTEMTSGIEDEKLNTIIRRSPLKTLIPTEDVAGMVEYLLSEKASHITGASFTLDAGSTA